MPKPRVMVYLAAAVSDFYVPWEGTDAQDQVERLAAGPSNLLKIDATDDGGVVIRLSQTPKMLGHVRSAWCLNAFVVGFKLETDPDILWKRQIEVFQSMHPVVANQMHGGKTGSRWWNPRGNRRG